MKKLLDLFNKGKKSKDNYYSFCSDSAPGTSRSFSLEKGIYKVSEPCETAPVPVPVPVSDSTISDRNERVVGIEKQNVNGIRGTEFGRIHQRVPQLESINRGSQMEMNTDCRDLESSSLNVKKKNSKNTESQSDSEFSHQDFIDSDFLLTESEVSLGSEKVQNKNIKAVPKKSTEPNNKGRNKFVINISNSKYFHIGSQKTINVTDFIKNDVDHLRLTSNVIEPSEMDLDEMLDCQEKLTEDNIELISCNLGEKWKGFAQYLDLEESVLRDIEVRNEHVIPLVVYDVLQNYMGKFPNTTLGFVINILKEISETYIIQEIIRKRKILM